VPPYVFTLAEGALPPGMRLSSGGVLSGTPTKVGTYVFSVAVTDASGRSASRSYTLLVRYRFVGVPLGVWDTTSFTDAWAGGWRAQASVTRSTAGAGRSGRGSKKKR
ncbi:MAG: hypothetical protein HGB05_08755, partial [Chloroflexi bacterium]|nr:hypothetical protein [Chloroflexota bacterium]